jgi:apolipoprotein D and lipocalin family protein
MARKYICIFTIVLFLPIKSISQEFNDSIITTVDSVDLSKYVGTWYEISKIPNSFQDHCIKNTTANYTINGDGDIIVINECIDSDGEIDDAEGLAVVVDKKRNSKLEVSFVSILGWHIFWGDYWILGLREDYKYAVIGTPSRKYGWVLSRTQQLNDSELEKCYLIFEQNGYEKSKFELSIQEL